MEKKTKFKITTLSHDKDSGLSKFSVSYSAKKSDLPQVSYKIISALKSEGDIIIEINSTLLNLSEYDNKTIISQFTDSLKKMGIEYQEKRRKVDSKRAIFSIRIQDKKVESFEVFAFIPHNIWCNEEFRKIIPKVGVRYYLLKTSSEYNQDTFINIEEDEKIELCRMVIFDHILLGSMGINTSIFEKNDIVKLLQK